MLHKRISMFIIFTILALAVSGCGLWTTTPTFECNSFSLNGPDPVNFNTDNTGSGVQIVYLRVYDSKGTLFDDEVARGAVGTSILPEGTVQYSRRSVGGNIFAELYSPPGGPLPVEQYIYDYADTINCPLVVPNLGIVQIDATMAQPAYAEPNGDLAKMGADEIWLPHDADHNGYDTYTVTGMETIDGRVWVSIFLGDQNFVWVPLDQVKVVSYLEEE